MAVNKRTRFEVLRRDDFTCRYCRSTENELTIDHVLAVARQLRLNLDDWQADIVRVMFAKTKEGRLASEIVAMRKAAEQMAAEKKAMNASIDHFHHAIWQSWSAPGGDELPLPADWRSSIAAQLEAGLSMDDLEEAVSIAMSRPGLRNGSCFRYAMGVCRNRLRDRAELAARILAEEDGDA